MPVDVDLFKRLGGFAGIACSRRHGRPRYPFYPSSWWCFTRVHVSSGIYSLFSEADIKGFRPPRCGGRRLSAFWREKQGYHALLPSSPPRPRGSLSTASTDVLVIGGGLAGVAAALKAAEFGASVTLVEESRLGGFLGSVEAPVPDSVGGWRSTLEFFAEAQKEMERTGVRVLEGHTYLGRVDEGYITVNGDGVVIVKPRIVIMATGGFSPLPLVKGNDLPGVVSAEYALRLAALASPLQGKVRNAVVLGFGEEALLVAGVLAREGVSVTLVHWETPRRGVYAEFAAGHGVDYSSSYIEEVKGEGRVESVILSDGTPLAADMVVSALPPYPDVVTPLQAGGSARYSLVTNSFVAHKNIYQEAVEGSVIVAGLASGALPVTTSYWSGVLAGAVAAWRLKKASEEDVNSILEDYVKKYGGAEILAEDRERPENVVVERPHAMVSPTLQDEAYIDPCNDVLVKDLRRIIKTEEYFKIFTLAERLGIGRGPELGRITLQTAAQVASSITGTPVDSIGFPLLTHLVRPVESWKLTVGGWP